MLFFQIHILKIKFYYIQFDHLILLDDKNIRHLDRLLGTDEIISINDLEALDEIPYSSPC